MTQTNSESDANAVQTALMEMCPPAYDNNDNPNWDAVFYLAWELGNITVYIDEMYGGESADASESADSSECR